MESKTPWTPGPWEVFEGGNFVRIGAAGYVEWSNAHHYCGGPLSVAEAEYNATENYDSDHEKAMANGRLIAAAPELYGALESIMKGFDDGVFVRSVEHDAASDWAVKIMRDVMALGKAHAALERARGSR